MTAEVDPRQEVRELFRRAVPEIDEGLVEVIAIARARGQRTKIAVDSEEIDAVDACVGEEEARVLAIVDALGGELIDIIPWHDDPVKYLCNALAPVCITKVMVDEEAHAVRVVFDPEDGDGAPLGQR